MNGKRPNGAGSIAVLKDGRYCVTFTTTEGKRVYRYRRIRKEAEIELARLIANDGTPPPITERPNKKVSNAPSLYEWVDSWLAAQEGQLRHVTYRDYEKLMKRVTATLGDKPLDALTPASLTAFFVDMRRKGVGSRQVQLTYTVFRVCLESAVRLEVLPDNPLRKVKKPKHETTRREYWSVAQTRAFLDAALASSRRYAPLLALLATTGLRISEALGLEWGDVSLERRTLAVRRALVFFGKEYRVDAPKTKAGHRTVSLPSQAVQALQRYAEATDATGRGPIFRTELGTPPTATYLRRPLLDLCKEAGVPPLNIHGLRHVAATMAIAATKDMHAVQRRLGHSHVSVTMGIYAYTLTDDAAVSDALDTLLRSDATT